MVFERNPKDSTDTFMIANDVLLADPRLHTVLPFKTTASQVDWAPDFHNPSSAMGYLGFGKRSTETLILLA